MKWQYQGKEVDSLPTDTFGFIYLIVYTDGSKYIGKKQAISKQTLPASKNPREGAIRIGKNVRGKRQYFDIVTKESGWRNYIGSCKEAVNLKVKEKHILQFAKDKINLTFNEVEWLIKYDTLRDTTFLNGNILGKFYKGRII